MGKVKASTGRFSSLSYTPSRESGSSTDGVMSSMHPGEIVEGVLRWASSNTAQALQNLSLWSLASGTVIIIVLIRFAQASLTWLRTWSILRTFPGPEGYFMFCGKLFKFCTSQPELDFNVGLLQVFLGLAQIYHKAKAYRVYLGLKPHVYIYSAEAMEVVLSESKNLDKTYAYKLVQDWLGNGLITSPGDIWKRRRRLLRPAFHQRIIEDSLTAMNSAADDLVTTLLQQSAQEGFVSNVLPHVQRCSLRITCEAAMGVNIEALSGYRRYVKAILAVGESFMHRFVRPWLWNSFFYYRCTSAGGYQQRNVNIIRHLAIQAIEARRELLTESTAKCTEAAELPSKERRCFMDILLNSQLTAKDSEKLTLDDICDEVVTFMFAGHDTTTASILFTLYLLGLYPDVQQKVYDELQEVLQGEERPLTLEDVKRLSYLERVTKESLRLFPPVPLVGRNITEDIVIDGHVVPKGTEVLLFILALHRDTTLFPEPEKFNPDRFLPENIASLHPFAWVPFSAGSRNCIGQKLAQVEVKIVVATLVRSCHLISLDTRDKLQLASEIVLRSKDPIRMRFLSRTLR